MQRKIFSFSEAKTDQSTTENDANAIDISAQSLPSSSVISEDPSASSEFQTASICGGPSCPDIGDLSRENIQQQETKLALLTKTWDNPSKFNFPMR